KELRAQHTENERARAQTAAAAGTPSKAVDFPVLDDRLKRNVCLVTLALWGDVDAGGRSAYLTAATAKLLRRMRDADAPLGDAMASLSNLCKFGPDGRAANDWATAAVGLAVDEAIATGKEKP